MKLQDLYNNFQYIGNGKGKNLDIKKVDIAELLTGIAVEKEHHPTINNRVSIALDHLAENAKYYTILIKSGLVDEPKAIAIYNKLKNLVIERKTCNK